MRDGRGARYDNVRTFPSGGGSLCQFMMRGLGRAHNAARHSLAFMRLMPTLLKHTALVNSSAAEDVRKINLNVWFGGKWIQKILTKIRVIFANIDFGESNPVLCYFISWIYPR